MAASTAYQGTTSSSPNIPALISQGIAWASSNVTGTTLTYYSPRTWVFSSSFTGVQVATTGFFGTEAKKLGFQVGDTLYTHGYGSSVVLYVVTAVGTTAIVFSSGLTLS